MFLLWYDDAMAIKTKKRSQAFYGAIFWILSTQYYFSQFIVGLGWSNPSYSWSDNTISNLGNTGCGLYGDQFICSPQHAFMNAAFIILGITMIGGAVLLRKHLGTTRAAVAGLGCVIAAGIGSIMVGLFPENTISALHIIGAALPFTLGNIGLILLGLSLRHIPKILRWSAIIMGVIALCALMLFLTHIYLGLGIGGMERAVSFPLTIWLTLCGCYLLSQASVGQPKPS